MQLVSSAVIPWISTHNLQNNAPCSGLVNQSVIIHLILKYSTIISAVLVLSLIKKYGPLMLFFCLVLDHLPLFSKILVIMLSCFKITPPVEYPWNLVK